MRVKAANIPKFARRQHPSQRFSQTAFTRRAHDEGVNTLRARLTAALLLALLAAPAGAQPAAPLTSTQVTPNRAAPSASLSDPLFTKTRPATFRLEQRSASDPREPNGLGTGFFISKDGLGLTAYHVVFAAKALSAKTLSGTRYPVEVVGYDENSDVAVVRVKVGSSVPFLPLTDVIPKIGDRALSIGNGGGAFLTPKRGTLRQLNVKSERADFPSGTLKLDAPLIPGDSGGPIINARGEAIGVVSYIQVGSDTSASFGVPVTRNSPLLAALEKGQKVDAPFIGIGQVSQVGAWFDSLKDEAFPALGLGPKPGVVFTSVGKNSPASRAGLIALNQLTTGDGSSLPKFTGDVILAVNGRPVRGFGELLAQIRPRKVGETVNLSVQRGNKVVNLKLTLASHAQVEAANP